MSRHHDMCVMAITIIMRGRFLKNCMINMKHVGVLTLTYQSSSSYRLHRPKGNTHQREIDMRKRKSHHLKNQSSKKKGNKRRRGKKYYCLFVSLHTSSVNKVMLFLRTGPCSGRDVVRNSLSSHLPQEIDTSTDYEGRDSRADYGEERNGADVLEEVTLNMRGHTAEDGFMGLVPWCFLLHGVT